MKKLLIVDGNNVFRRQAANPKLARLTFKGQTTGAIHGTVKSILSDITTYRPDGVVVVFDGQGARAEKQKQYAGYKANRMSSMTDDLHQQMVITIDILKHAGILVMQKAGVDADDVIGALATIPGWTKLIRSNDKDFFSTLGPTCRQIRMTDSGDVIWTAAKLLAEWGIKPSQVPDYLALKGDGIDGIPGLKNCGSVGAVKLLKQYKCLKNIVQQRAELPDKLRKQVEEQKSELRTFLRLTRLDTTVVTAKAMATIVPRLKPSPYSKGLLDLCQRNGLQWLSTWFTAHSPTVVSQTAGVFS